MNMQHGMRGPGPNGPYQQQPPMNPGGPNMNMNPHMNPSMGGGMMPGGPGPQGGGYPPQQQQQQRPIPQQQGGGGLGGYPGPAGGLPPNAGYGALGPNNPGM